MDITPEQGTQVTSELESLNAESDSQESTPENSANDVLEVINSLKGEIETLKEQQQKQSQYVGKLEKQLKKPEDPKKEAKNPLQAQVEELQEKMKLAEEKEIRLREREKLSSVREAVSQVAGMESKQAELFANLLIANEKQNIEVVEEDGRYKVQYRVGEANPQDINAFVKEYFQTDVGRAFLPTKNNPASGKNASGFSAGKQTATRDDLRNGRVDLEALRRGDVIIK